MIVEPSSRDPDREQRLEQALAQYLEACARGDPPDRGRFLSDHSDLAADLGSFLMSRAKLQAMAASLRPSVTPCVPALKGGRLIGDYEILGVIARGGMGVVYRARQRGLDRPVALKMLRNGDEATADDLRRFEEEARAIAGLDHPNIVPVYEIGHHDGHVFFSMKLVEGGSLADRIGEDAVDPREAARVVAAIAQAIDHAHRRGILHRDLKPSNILIDERGEPMVADFGLALRSGSDSLRTRTGLFPGTPAFMSPEQVDGPREAITPATDVHGLGAILYVLLTGRAPFRGRTPLSMLCQVRDRQPDRPRSIRRSIPRDLETICLKCLQKQPSQRYATAAELADDLDRWRQHRPIRARRIGLIGRSWRLARRHPKTSMVAVVLIAVAVAGLWEVRERARRNEEARRQAQALADDRFARDLAEGFDAWKKGLIERVRLILERYRPSPGAPDHRGFACRFLDRLVSIDRPNFAFHLGAVYCAAYSPDGTVFATAGQDRTIQLRDSIHGEDAPDLNGHTNEVASVAFSPDGRLLVSASDDQSVRIWDLHAHREIATLLGHADEVVGALFTPDGRRLISASRKGKVIVWDTDTWSPLHSFQAPNGPRLEGLALSPDGTTLAIAGRGILLVDLPTGRQQTLAQPAARDVNCLAFSHDGRLLAAAGPKQFVRLWRTADWSLAARLEMDQDTIEGVTFSPDDRILAAVGNQGVIHLIDPETTAFSSIVTGHGHMWCILFRPDGRSLLTTGMDGAVRLWKLPLDDPRIAISLPTRSPVEIAFSPDGSEVTIADDRGRVWIHDTHDGHRKTELRLDDGLPVVRTELSEDARWLVTESASHESRTWSLPDGRLREGARPARRGDGVVPSPHDPRMVSRVAEVHGREITCQAVSFDGARLATGDDRGRIVVWDAATLEPLWSTTERSTPVNSLAFAPEGRTLASGDENRQVTFWDVATGRRLTSLKGHSGPVKQVRFSPNGMTMASTAMSPIGTTEMALWPTRRADGAAPRARDFQVAP